MCGFIVALPQNGKANSSQLEQALHEISHRGPDGQRAYWKKSDPQVLMGHARLSINDLSDVAFQPLVSEDARYVLAFNGEIYNFRDLREELTDVHEFVTKSDSEVIIAAYKKWGVDCLKHFNGMWAFVLLDNQKQELFVSRDRFGVKPLYYRHNQSHLIFSSEVKPIKVYGDLKANHDEVVSFLLGGQDWSAEETDFEDIYNFPAGHYAIVSLVKPEIKTQRFWHLPQPSRELDQVKFDAVEFEGLKNRFYDLMKDAVRIRMMSDVHFGSALSGGIDSSSIVYLANEIMRDSGDRAQQYTFSNVYKGLPGFEKLDESRFVETLISQFNLNAKIVSPVENDFRQVALNKIDYIEHLAGAPEIASYYVYGLPKANNVKITLDGQGSDEQTGGYTGFWKSYCYSLGWKCLGEDIPVSQPLRMILSLLAFFGLGSVLMALKNWASLASEIRWARFAGVKMNGSLLSYYLKRKRRPGHAGVRQLMRYKFDVTLRTLLRAADSNSMQFSVESRMPFMDYRIVEFLAQLPTCYLFHGGFNKYILRKAFEGKLPNEIVWRRDKRGFDDPDHIWLARKVGANRQWADELILKGSGSEYQIDSARLDRLFDKNFALYMRLLMLNLWKNSTLFKSESVHPQRARTSIAGNMRVEAAGASIR